jgi:hypothetical protein
MPTKEFVMRGQTNSGEQEVLNFSGYKPGYAYRLIEFKLWPSSNIGGTSIEACGIINAGKTTAAPTDPNFNDEGTIGVATHNRSTSPQDGPFHDSVINDTFLITQNLILMVQNTGSGSTPVNWQCRFVAEKMTGPEEAVANYKQFTISDG